MSKDIPTKPVKTYVVMLSQEGTLSGRTDAGDAMVLASSDAAGQVSFQAISQVTICSDDGATVLPFVDAPLPIGVDGGASAAQVAEMVESALYVPQGMLVSVSLRSRSGNNPASLSYLALWELGRMGRPGLTWVPQRMLPGKR